MRLIRLQTNKPNTELDSIVYRSYRNDIDKLYIIDVRAIRRVDIDYIRRVLKVLKALRIQGYYTLNRARLTIRLNIIKDIIAIKQIYYSLYLIVLTPSSDITALYNIIDIIGFKKHTSFSKVYYYLRY